MSPPATQAGVRLPSAHTASGAIQLPSRCGNRVPRPSALGMTKRIEIAELGVESAEAIGHLKLILRLVCDGEVDLDQLGGLFDDPPPLPKSVLNNKDLVQRVVPSPSKPAAQREASLLAGEVAPASKYSTTSTEKAWRARSKRGTTCYPKPIPAPNTLARCGASRSHRLRRTGTDGGQRLRSRPTARIVTAAINATFLCSLAGGSGDPLNRSARHRAHRLAAISRGSLAATSTVLFHKGIELDPAITSSKRAANAIVCVIASARSAEAAPPFS